MMKKMATASNVGLLISRSYHVFTTLGEVGAEQKVFAYLTNVVCGPILFNVLCFCSNHGWEV